MQNKNTRQKKTEGMLSGIVSVLKPKGLTSMNVVRSITRGLSAERQFVNTKGKPKVGHGGTLDSFATGVMVIGINNGTKLMSDFLHGNKGYVATGKFGTETDTADPNGDIVREMPFNHVTRELLEKTLALFRGEIEQMPPNYSAKHVPGTGKRAHELALSGEDVQALLKPCPVTIYSLELTDFKPPYFTIECFVSGGTYVRSLVVDIAKALNSCAHVESLNRTKQGDFTEANSLTLDQAADPIIMAPKIQEWMKTNRDLLNSITQNQRDFGGRAGGRSRDFNNNNNNRNWNNNNRNDNFVVRDNRNSNKNMNYRDRDFKNNNNRNFNSNNHSNNGNRDWNNTRNFNSNIIEKKEELAQDEAENIEDLRTANVVLKYSIEKPSKRHTKVFTNNLEGTVESNFSLINQIVKDSQTKKSTKEEEQEIEKERNHISSKRNFKNDNRNNNNNNSNTNKEKKPKWQQIWEEK